MLSLVVAAAFATLPTPPFRRVWTVPMGTEIRDVCLRGNIAYIVSTRVYEAVSLPSGKVLWKKPLPDRENAYVAAGPNAIYLMTAAYKNKRNEGWIIEIDPATGNPRWKIPRTGNAEPGLVANGILYTSWRDNHIGAIDLRIRKPRWEVSIDSAAGGMRGLERVPLLAGGILYLGLERDTIQARDSRNGKLLWKSENEYGPGLPILVGGVVVTSSKAGVVGRNPKTGKALWHGPEGYVSTAVSLGGNIVLSEGSRVVALSPKTGVAVWEAPVGDQNVIRMGSGSGLIGDVLLVQNEGYKAIQGDGRFQWQTPSLGGRSPLWTDGTTIVMSDLNRLMAYRKGVLPPVPMNHDQRVALAKKLAAEFDDIDENERAQLEKLAPESFAPLIELLIAAENGQEKLDRGENMENFDVSYEMYSRSQDATRILGRTISPEASPLLADAVMKLRPGSAARSKMMMLFMERPDPKVAEPVFVEVLKSTPRAKWERSQEIYAALTGLANSDYAPGIDLLLDVLHDKAVNEDSRDLVYSSVVRNGGAKAAAEVLKERSGRKLLPLLAERVRAEFASMRRSPIVKQKDGWVLLTCGALANGRDLWFAKLENGKPANPVFTGLTMAEPRGFFQGDKSQFEFHGKKVAAIVAGDWVKELVEAPELRKDGDADGLTDLVEKRLGTDATKKDTDGDGDDDQVDPWPTVARQATTDDERALSAAFEAMYHFSSWGPAVVRFPKEMKPFEMPGRKEPCLVSGEGTMASQYENGVAMIGFRGGMENSDASLAWNSDHTEMTLIVSTYYGGLNGTGVEVRVRKFGNDWVPILKQQRYVS